MKKNFNKKKIVKKTATSKKAVTTRMYIVALICFACFLVVLTRAVYLHLSDNSDLKWIADKQYNARVPLSARRGKIFDRNGEELAVSLPVPSIYADPSLIKDVEKTADTLSKKLNVNKHSLIKKFKMDRRFVWVKRRISYNRLKKVMALKLPGISYIEESKRFYPNGELASQVLGAVGYDSQALAGIELAYNDALISKKRLVSYKRDAKGRLYAAPLGFKEQSDVGSVYLTIDKQIQFITENALRSAVKKYNAKNGIAVVVDPNNGDVLAMANAPLFDPNRYSKYPISNWRNRSVTDSFEPGSTFKVLVVAAALNEGIINPESVYNCERGAVKIGSHTLKDHHPYDDLSVQDIIKYSSNIGAMKIAEDLGSESLYKTLTKFEIGNITGIDYPGEVQGVFRDYEKWRPVEQATVAFGQGLSVTPIQMTAAFSAAINGGFYYTPRLVSRIIEREGNVKINNQGELLGRPVRKDVSKTLRYMLRRVVEEGGTGSRAYSSAYTIGGKTGTAQKVIDSSEGYAKDKYFSSFIGFAPVEKPKLVVFVGIDEPKDVSYGGVVAAPAVKEIIERSLNHLGVPSLNVPIQMVEQAKGNKSTDSVDKLVRYSTNKAEFLQVGESLYLMPNLRGLTLRDVLVAVGDADLNIDTKGSGIAIKQTPEPGNVLKDGEKFTVRFELPR